LGEFQGSRIPGTLQGRLSKPAAVFKFEISQAVWDTVADEELHAAFRAFAIFGAGGTPKSSGAAGPKAPVLDSGRFVKLVRDSGLLDSRLTATAVELTFSKVKGQVRALIITLWTQ
jgi:hypothetical protein